MAAGPVVRVGKIVSPAKAFKGGFWAGFPGRRRWLPFARSRKPTGGSQATYGRRRISAARSVFDISIATVIGPTPPGTGEIHPATSLTGP